MPRKDAYCTDGRLFKKALNGLICAAFRRAQLTKARKIDNLTEEIDNNEEVLHADIMILYC